MNKGENKDDDWNLLLHSIWYSKIDLNKRSNKFDSIFSSSCFFLSFTSNFDRTEGQTKNRRTRLYGSCVLSIFLSIERTSNCYTSIYICTNHAYTDEGQMMMMMVVDDDLRCRDDVRRQRERKVKNERNNIMMRRKKFEDKWIFEWRKGQWIDGYQY